MIKSATRAQSPDLRMSDTAGTMELSYFEDPYYPLRLLATYSGLSIRTLRKKLVDLAHPLPFHRIGGKILVRRSDYDAWAVRFRVTNPSKLDALVSELLKEL